eukprot:4868569-Lingulodinium_polyedra.AAC.1
MATALPPNSMVAHASCLPPPMMAARTASDGANKPPLRLEMTNPATHRSSSKKLRMVSDPTTSSLAKDTGSPS